MTRSAVLSRLAAEPANTAPTTATQRSIVRILCLLGASPGQLLPLTSYFSANCRKKRSVATFQPIVYQKPYTYDAALGGMSLFDIPDDVSPQEEACGA